MTGTETAPQELQTVVIGDNEEWTFLPIRIRGYGPNGYGVFEPDDEGQKNPLAYLLEQRVLRFPRGTLNAFHQKQKDYDAARDRELTLYGRNFLLFFLFVLVWALITASITVQTVPFDFDRWLVILLAPISLVLVIWVISYFKKKRQLTQSEVETNDFRQAVLKKYYPGIELGEIGRYVLLPYPEQHTTTLL